MHSYTVNHLTILWSLRPSISLLPIILSHTCTVQYSLLHSHFTLSFNFLLLFDQVYSLLMPQLSWTPPENTVEWQASVPTKQSDLLLTCNTKKLFPCNMKVSRQGGTLAREDYGAHQENPSIQHYNTVCNPPQPSISFGKLISVRLKQVR